MKVTRSERSSVYEKFWRTAILGAAIPELTITCFILPFARPTRHIALSTKPVLDEIDDLIGSGLWPTKGKGGQRQKSNLQNESAMGQHNHIIAKSDRQPQELRPNHAFSGTGL